MMGRKWRRNVCVGKSKRDRVSSCVDADDGEADGDVDGVDDGSRCFPLLTVLAPMPVVFFCGADGARATRIWCGGERLFFFLL